MRHVGQLETSNKEWATNPCSATANSKAMSNIKEK